MKPSETIKVIRRGRAEAAAGARTRAEIDRHQHQQLDALARSGIAIIAISSELPEILAISDRIITIREGRITGNVQRDNAQEETLMHLMAVDAAPQPVA